MKLNLYDWLYIASLCLVAFLMTYTLFEAHQLQAETCIPTDHKRVWTRSRYSTEDDMKLVEMEKTTHRKWACPGSEDEWRGE